MTLIPHLIPSYYYSIDPYITPWVLPATHIALTGNTAVQFIPLVYRYKTPLTRKKTIHLCTNRLTLVTVHQVVVCLRCTY